ncbi:MAG: peptide chain release factor N(5)-glutamine methyltransferase [Dehalococcoidia bacterium]|nr:peptide chain release factor N(5)-glutamine methyltransferase [Dehalococcoidia bacterium]
MPPRINGRLIEAARQLIEARAADDLDEGRLEAELLYAEAAGWDRVRVLASGAEVPEFEVLARFEALLDRRLAHEPLAYILGRREFYGLTFEVGPGCLVPRPETETLVEAALAAIREHPHAHRLVRVADVGTGSGAVALAVAKHALQAEVFATDASTEALEWAGRNRAHLGLTDRVVLLTGDLLEPIGEPLDVVLANLPYIPTEEVERLPEVIRTHEPRLAVDGGEDGLDLYRRLAEQLPSHLAEGVSAVLIEVGSGQASFAADVLTNALVLRQAQGERIGLDVRYHRDLAGTRRVVEVRRGY